MRGFLPLNYHHVCLADSASSAAPSAGKGKQLQDSVHTKQTKYTFPFSTQRWMRCKYASYDKQFTPVALNPYSTLLCLVVFSCFQYGFQHGSHVIFKSAQRQSNTAIQFDLFRGLFDCVILLYKMTQENKFKTYLIVNFIIIY